MAACEAGQHHQHETKTPSDNLPLVLIHRIPQFDLSYKSWLPATKFRLLDPLDPSFSSTPSAQTLAQSAHLLLCLGPSPLTQHTLDRYPSIECVVGSSAGLDLSDCRRRGITVTNAGDAFSDDVADFSVALLLDVPRRVSASNRYVRAGSWPVKGDYLLGSKNVGALSWIMLDKRRVNSSTYVWPDRAWFLNQLDNSVWGGVWLSYAASKTYRAAPDLIRSAVQSTSNVLSVHLIWI